MKKLMIVLAVAAMAVASQAASFKWATDTATTGVTLASLNGNTSVAANGATLATGNTGSRTATLYIYDAVTKDLVGSANASVVNFAYTGVKGITGSFTVSGTFTASTTYDYVLDVSLVQNDMKTYTTGEWDYTAATLTAQYKGSLKTAATGATTFTTSSPTAWTVSGAKNKEPEPTPEPTSAMLMLLGVAGLALRRKQK